MNKRSSKNSHGKRYLGDVKEKKVHWKTVILQIKTFPNEKIQKL